MHLLRASSKNTWQQNGAGGLLYGNWPVSAKADAKARRQTKTRQKDKSG